MKRIHLIIRGRVQGVCFRMYTQSLAEKLGVRGWVRNNPDGSVETVAEAEQEILDEFLAGVRRGPPGARVDSVTPRETQDEGDLTAFRIA